MTTLVTGGAGYIGGHVVRALQEHGHTVAVVDDLSTGSRDVVPADVPLLEFSVSEGSALRAALADLDVDGVVHLAALKSVDESEREPVRYYRENVGGMATLLGACEATGVGWFVLSSSAAVYGSPEGPRVLESAPTRPESAYGETKLVCEWLLRRAGRATGIRWAALRYFNVVGAGEPALGDTGEANLFPRVMRAITAGANPLIFGSDYPTPDGTCVRDYVHVGDLADAHVVTAEAVRAGRSEAVYNVGTGTGASVREVVDGFREVSGVLFEPEIAQRRPGDPAAVVADVGLIADELGWTARFSLEQSVRDSWRAWQWRHPR